jgi:3-hydroxyisobutyrate dehydrogenase-like beta-hydroxyacid dehydrogenase
MPCSPPVVAPFVISERVGDGARTKLVNNLLAGINLVGAAEALALAERLGWICPPRWT